MRVVIYESSSHGGCFEYAKELFKAYSFHPEVDHCVLLVPSQSNLNEKNIFKILCNDVFTTRITILRKFYFLFRVLVNPFILFFFLIKKKETFVIFNDFEQLTSFVWVPFFKLFLGKHRFAVVLHDPDRDDYPPSKSFSESSMKKLLSIMDFALYHEGLPTKPYYLLSKTIYINIPHGVYLPALPDSNFTKELQEKIGKNYKTLAILGNIRKEKNYDLAIESLQHFPSLKLIIAGKLANQNVDIAAFKHLAEKLKVMDRVIWIEKYLTDHELSSLINFSDIILLNYSKSFKSQSGILNLIAPYKKKIIISRGDSSLSLISNKFNLGILIEPDNIDALKDGISKSFLSDFSENWSKYLEFASWKHHTDIVLEAYKSN